MTPSSTHLVLIPSFNPGAKVFSTVQAALSHWAPVWVVVDGSTDHSEHRLLEMAVAEPNLRVWVLPKNRGKGAAVLFGMREARALGFTHVLTLDSDGQHPTASIPEFMQASLASPSSMVLGNRYLTTAPPVCASKAEKYPTGGPTSRRFGPASTTRCLAFVSIPSVPSSTSCTASSGCGVSTSTWRQWCDCAGAACGPSIYPRPCATSARRKAAYPIFVTGETTRFSLGCISGCFLDFWCACRCWPPGEAAQIHSAEV